MSLPLTSRLASSFKALGTTWCVSGIVFAMLIRGPGTVSAWCIWATPFFLAGWIVVGLPLVACGKRALHIPLVLLGLLGGVGGALVMALPMAIVALVDSTVHWDFTSLTTWGWEGTASLIAASATLLYRLFLIHDRKIAERESTA